MITLPNSTQRLTVIGRTGTGKTVAGLWHLSKRNLQAQRWIAFDFKGDDKIEQLSAPRIDIGRIPKSPGLYIVNPRMDEESALEDYFWALWSEGRLGIYIDEGYMIEDSKAFDTLLTQGRSLNIPMIVLTQRPVWISRFCFSEADYFQVFDLNDDADWDRIRSFSRIPTGIPLPEYNSWYYSVAKKQSQMLAPVPSETQIISVINSFLKKRAI